VTYERTEDLELVRSIMTHPRVYPHITDDGSPAAAEFQPVNHPAIWYVLARDGDELLGLYMFIPQGAACWEVHTCLLPASWGARAAAAAAGAAAWLFERTTCRRIVTSVPSYNRLALRYAERAGMQQFGVNPRSFLKDGKLHDQVLLGLSKD
jgi:RimJ/RimL family protein N-acetyltransferase